MTCYAFAPANYLTPAPRQVSANRQETG